MRRVMLALVVAAVAAIGATPQPAVADTGPPVLQQDHAVPAQPAAAHAITLQLAHAVPAVHVAAMPAATAAVQVVRSIGHPLVKRARRTNRRTLQDHATLYLLSTSATFEPAYQLRL